MKKLNYLILLLLLVVPIKVFAFNVEINCQSEVQAGEDFTCTLFGDVSEAQLELDLPTGFMLKNNVASKNFNSASEDTILKYIATGSHDRVMAVLTITAPNVNSVFTLNFKNIKFKYYESELNYNTKEDIKINVTVKGQTTTKPTTTVTTTTTMAASTSSNYVATLDSNGSDQESQSLSCSPAQGICVINLNSAVTPTRDGYTFKGWNISDKCTEGKTGSYNLIGNITLYACWESLKKEQVILPYLSSITIDGKLIDNFSKDIYDYNYKVAIDVDNIDVVALPENSEDIVSIDKPDKLVVGNNVVVISVLNGEETLTYKINVEKGVSVGDAKLANITIDNYNLDFNSSIYTYNLTIDNKTDNLNIKVTTVNEDDTYEIIGNSDLKDGGQIIIKVTSSNNTANYIINIYTTSFIQTYFKYIISGGILLFIFIVYFIVSMHKDPTKTKKANKKNKNKKDNIKKDNSKKSVKDNSKKEKNIKEPIEKLETL